MGAPVSPMPPAVRYRHSISALDASMPVADRRWLATATGPHIVQPVSLGPTIPADVRQHRASRCWPGSTTDVDADVVFGFRSSSLS